MIIDEQKRLASESLVVINPYLLAGKSDLIALRPDATISFLPSRLPEPTRTRLKAKIVEMAGNELTTTVHV